MKDLLTELKEAPAGSIFIASGEWVMPDQPVGNCYVKRHNSWFYVVDDAELDPWQTDEEQIQVAFHDETWVIM